MAYILTSQITKQVSKFFSTISTKREQESTYFYNKFPELTSVPKTLRMDFDKILSKPFNFSTVDWNTTDPVGELASIQLPSEALTNFLTTVPFETATFFRAKLRVIMQVSGTPMHMGMIMASAVPFGVPGFTDLNSGLNAPHCFMFANESTPVSLEVPFYVNAPLIRTPQGINSVPDYTDFDYAQIVLYVQQPLTVATGASAPLSIVLNAIFDEIEFYVPKNARWEAQGMVDELYEIPTKALDNLARGAKVVAGDIIDSARNAVKTMTGFHNPNDDELKGKTVLSFRNYPNNIDQPTIVEKLDPYSKFSRIYSDYYFQTDVDEMSLSHLLSKPAYVGTFVLDTYTPIGTNLFTLPISPCVEVGSKFYSNLRTFYEMTRFWKGSLKLKIQAVMTNFHFCKLICIKNYGIDVTLLNNVPTYESLRNLPNDIMEFSAGGQVCEIDLPYCASSSQLENTKDYNMVALNHGLVYCYLLQPLIANNNVPIQVQFNVYMSAGDDFQYFGYTNDYFNIEPNLGFKAQGETIVDTSSQDTLKPTENPIPDLYSRHFHPVTSVRDLVRRLQPGPTITLDTNYKVIRISDLLTSSTGVYSPFQVIRARYLGMTGGLKFKFRLYGVKVAQLYYVPPGTKFDSITNTIKSTAPSSADSAIMANFLDSISFSTPTSLKFATPFIELTDYSRPLALIANTGTSNLEASNTTLLEFTIPNMNPLNFVGDISLLFPGSEPSFRSDLGYIVLSLDLPENTVGYLQPYVALSDEARLGFQVFAPMTSPLYFSGAGGVKKSTIFNWNDDLEGAPSFLPQHNLPYYFKHS